jgi:hypothetical protein
MEAGDGYAGIVIEPNHDPARTWIQTGVVSTRHGITSTASSDDCERLKRSRLQVLADVTDHAVQDSSQYPGAAIAKSLFISNKKHSESFRFRCP